MDSVTLRPWPLKIPASSQNLLEELQRWEVALKDREQRVDELEEQSRERVYDQGMKQARDEAFAHLTRQIAALRADFEELEQQIQSQLPDLAASLATKIVGAELLTAPERIATMTSTLLEEHQLGGALTLRLHPREHTWAVANLESLQRVLKGTVQLECDESLNPGEVVIATSRMTIEGTFSVFQKQIRDLIS